MKLDDLNGAVAHTLLEMQVMYRVQRKRTPADSVLFGEVAVPPAGKRLHRFDPGRAPAGYFAETPATAIYEALARREALYVTIEQLRARQLLVVEVTRSLRLLDVRHLGNRWPVLASLRYSETQELADAALAAGFHGIIYKSAQQDGADCIALFGDALAAMTLRASQPLVDPSTSLMLRPVHDALRGACLPLMH